MPTADKAVKDNRKSQSISLFWISPEKPINELMVMTNNEVAIAFLMVKRASLISAGTIKKPPPAPINPIKTPTKNN